MPLQLKMMERNFPILVVHYFVKECECIFRVILTTFTSLYKMFFHYSLEIILTHKYILIFFRFSCCCECFSESCIGKSWAGFRLFVFNIVDNPFFEWTILLLIFASSLSLCFEDINLQDNEEVSL